MDSQTHIDHIVYVLVAFVVAIGCFTALSLVGTQEVATLRDVVLALGGVLGGVAVGKVRP